MTKNQDVSVESVRQRYFVTYKEGQDVITLVKENGQYCLYKAHTVQPISPNQTIDILSKITSKQVKLIGFGVVGQITGADVS